MEHGVFSSNAVLNFVNQKHISVIVFLKELKGKSLGNVSFQDGDNFADSIFVGTFSLFFT
jgi:hypothetical protein